MNRRDFFGVAGLAALPVPVVFDGANPQWAQLRKLLHKWYLSGAVEAVSAEVEQLLQARWAAIVKPYAQVVSNLQLRQWICEGKIITDKCGRIASPRFVLDMYEGRASAPSPEPKSGHGLTVTPVPSAISLPKASLPINVYLRPGTADTPPDRIAQGFSESILGMLEEARTGHLSVNPKAKLSELNVSLKRDAFMLEMLLYVHVIH